MTFSALSNGAYRVSLRDPEAELEDCSNKHAPSTGRARVNLRGAGVSSRTRGTGGGVNIIPPANSKTNGRRNTRQAAFESS